jgi:hypothetical protein
MPHPVYYSEYGISTSFSYWMSMYIRKVLRPAISKQVFLASHRLQMLKWIQSCELLLHVSNALLSIQFN